MKILKKLGWVLSVLVVLAVGSLVAVAMLVDPNDYKPEITALVKQHTSRELTLDGDIELAFFPWLGFKTGHLTLSNPAGFGTAPMLEVDKADLKINLLSLLVDRMEVDTVQLHHPRLNLVRKADGRSNWDDLLPDAEYRLGVQGDRALSDLALLAGLAVQGVVVVDGRLSWDDRRTGRRVAFTALHMNSGKLVSGGRPAPIDFSVDVNGSELVEPLAITLTTTARLGENLEFLTLHSTRYQTTRPSGTSELSVDALTYTLPAGLLVATDIANKATRQDVETRVTIPQLTFNTVDENLQVPMLTISQRGFDLTGAIYGDHILSKRQDVVLYGRVDTRIDHPSKLLRRNGLGSSLSLRLIKSVAISGDFLLKDDLVRVTKLDVRSPIGANKPPLNQVTKMTLPMEPHIPPGKSIASLKLGSLLTAMVKKELGRRLCWLNCPPTERIAGEKTTEEDTQKDVDAPKKTFKEKLKKRVSDALGLGG